MILGVFDDLFDRPLGQRLGILGVLLIVVWYADHSLWYGPNAEQLNQQEEQVMKLRDELSGKESKANTKAQAETELRELNAELRHAQARLPDQREIANLLSSIAASGRQAGLEITLFRQKPESPADFYAAVPVEMEMRGTYHDVAAFLDRVKRLDRIVNVTNINLSKPRGEGERVLLDASCTVTTFRFLDEAERRALEEQRKKQGNKGAGKT
jgi:type IV pilus assembly protein PilO